MDRWVSFDCYGTLIDWEAGIGVALGTVWPAAVHDPAGAIEAFLETETTITDGALTYREILTQTLRAVAATHDLGLTDQQQTAVADSLPSWKPFPEVPRALHALRDAGWKLAILSNTDPDYLDASIGQLGITIDLTIVGSQIGSYKPAHGHWDEFRRVTRGSDRHVHVGASLTHDIEPCAQLQIPAIWINRSGATSALPRLAELSDLSGLPEIVIAT